MSFRILISFHYFRDVDLDEVLAAQLPGVEVDLLADSGAFSAYTQGAAIDIAEYGEWLLRWRHLFTNYISLDVIGKPEASWANQKHLESLGLTPIPVFHALEDFNWLHDYIEGGYTLVGLGGIALARQEARFPWLIKCFREARGRTAFHGLGVTDTKLLDLPFWSVDSSSWATSVMFGSAKLFDPMSGKLISIQLGDHAKVYRHAGLFRRYGFDPATFADRKKYTRQQALALAYTSVVMTERWMRKRHGPILRPGGPPGPRVYGVQSNSYDWLKTDKGIAEGADQPAANRLGPRLYVVEAFTLLRQPREAVEGLEQNGLRASILEEHQ